MLCWIMALRQSKPVMPCYNGWFPLLDKFPRVRRFTLGGRIEDNLLTVLESLVEAAYSPAAVKQHALNNNFAKIKESH